MKIRCDRNELLDRLQSISGIVSATTTKPILQCCLLKATPERLSLEVTDLDISSRLLVERHEVEEPGMAVLPAARLTSLLRELPGGSVTFETAQDGRSVDVKAESYEFRLLGEDAEEFPDVKGFAAETSLTLQRDKVADMFRRVGIAAARDASRYQLSGVFVEIEDEDLQMTATDGKRLTHDSMRISNPKKICVSAIIPNRAVDALCRILSHGSDEVQLALHETEVQVGFDHGALMAKLVEGTFPEYQSVIPTEVKTRVKARRSELLQAAKGASLVTDKETATIRFRFGDDGIELESKASDIGKSRIQIEAEVQGDPLEIRFNPAFFIDALRTVNDEEVRMEFYGEDKPGAVRDGQNYRHFLMPLVVG
jgi:DNA polymerase-3 subunit beta